MAPAQLTQVLLVGRRDPQDPIRRIMRDAGYPVVSLDSVSSALRAAEVSQPRLIVADPRALPPADRDELASFAAKNGIPIIVGWTDHASLLNQVEKTLTPQEAPDEGSRHLAVGLLRVDLDTRVVRLGEAPLELTAREFDLLAHFARHPGWVYSRQELLEQVWGYDYGDTKVVTVHVAHLRKKIEEAAPGCRLIETVHNVGYRLTPATVSEFTPVELNPPQTATHRLRSKSPRTRLVGIGVAAAAVMLIGLGVGLWLGLWGGDGTARFPGAETVIAADQSAMVRWGPETVTEEDEYGKVLWQATWWVYARQANTPNAPDTRWGSEVMDWSVTLPPPTAPPLGRNETADLLYFHLDRVGDASVATVIFAFDTTDWEHPGPPNAPFPNPVYHKFILTDNPGSQLDHVEGYAGRPAPDEAWALKFMDIDCAGVEIIYYPAAGDDANAGATSTTQE